MVVTLRWKFVRGHWHTQMATPLLGEPIPVDTLAMLNRFVWWYTFTFFLESGDIAITDLFAGPRATLHGRWPKIRLTSPLRPGAKGGTVMRIVMLMMLTLLWWWWWWWWRLFVLLWSWCRLLEVPTFRRGRSFRADGETLIAATRVPKDPQTGHHNWF